jgi:hypothetical protein
MLERDKDKFALSHFTGECEYVVDEKWVEMDRAQVVSHHLQVALRTSSCAVVLDLAQVS